MKQLLFTKPERDAILLLCAAILIITVVVRVTIRTENPNKSTVLDHPDTINVERADTVVKINKKDSENLILYNF
ncbi:MAG: hypothetical protein RR277_05845 [Rikenellaceae bacterium]